MIDVHNHLIPGVDDGARDTEDSREAVAALQADGVYAVVTTPHLDASDARSAENLARIDEGWRRLRAAVGPDPGIELHRGVELALDTPEPDLSDERVRLAATRFALVEFPLFTVPPRAGAVIETIRAQGWVPVLAHPERYEGLEDGLEQVRAWKRSGAYLQINGPSLLGRYGAQARRLAWALIGQGLADYLASDYHSRGRPGIVDCRDALADAGGTEQIELLTVLNPARILEDLAPVPVPSLDVRRSWWRRLTDLLG